MAGLGKIFLITAIGAIIATLLGQGYATRPEISYYLEPLPEINLGPDRIGRISIMTINRGGTSAGAIIHLKGDNIEFVERDNVPNLEIKDGEVFHHVHLARDKESYGLSSDYFYVGENVDEFSINVEINVKHELSFSELSLIFNSVEGLYPIVVEYIQTGPNEYSLK